MRSMSQSIHATTPSMSGEPDPAGRHGTPANLSGVFDENWRHSNSCSAARMLTQNELLWRIFGQLVDFLSGMNATRGGSSDSDVNDPTAMPAGRDSGPIAVMMQTPVGYWPRTCRKRAGSMDAPD